MFIFLCESCSCQRQKENNTIKFSNDVMITDVMITKDAQQLSNSFISNVEKIREVIVSTEKSGIDYTGEIDPANVFLPYAIRFNTNLDRYQASPIPTYKQISVGADTIVYSSDSLLCVALLVIKNHFTDMYPFETDRKDGYYYDGRAVIGCRDTITEPFQIYPFTIFAIIAYNNIDEVSEDLKRFYFHDIVGLLAPTGTNLEGDIYTRSLSDPDFFTEAPNFKLNEFGEFKFKYYLKGNKEIPYQYSDNRHNIR